jgi:hypothetical protein
MTLYTFWTVFPPGIRSSKLHIQQQAYVEQLLLLPAGSSSCLKYACCCMWSFELLMPDGKTVQYM